MVCVMASTPFVPVMALFDVTTFIFIGDAAPSPVSTPTPVSSVTTPAPFMTPVTVTIGVMSTLIATIGSIMIVWFSIIMIAWLPVITIA